MNWRLLAQALVVGALVAGGAARANPFETFGFGPRAVALGGGTAASAADHTAVFYNPAMLVARPHFDAGLSFLYFRPDATVESTGGAKELDCTYCTPPDTSGWSFGALFPFAGKGKDRVAFGLGVYVPNGDLVRVQSVDPGRPYWAMFNSAQERLGLYAGLAVKLVDGLSLGLGVQVLADLLGRGAAMEVDLFSKQVTLREIDASLRVKGAPTAGLWWSPVKRLSLGLGYRAEMTLRYQVPARVDLDAVGDLSFTVSGVRHYTPHTVCLAAAFEVTEQVALMGEVAYARWSDAPSPYMAVDITPSGDVLKALGLDEAFGLSSPAGAPGFQDTVSGKLAVEAQLTPAFTVRAGGFYRPTPVPLQNAAQTNVLDASAVGVGLGLGVAFADPLGWFERPLRFDLGAQGQFLMPREAQKDPTDPTPSYRYSARVLGGSAALGYRF